MQEQVAGAIPIDEIARTLALSPIFARFDQGSLLAVAGKCGFATFEAGATIMRQGDPGNFAYLILEGEVDIFVEIPVGRIHMSTLGRGNTIGELGAFTDMPRTATAVARTDLVLLRTDREGLMSLAADFPVIAVTIVSELGQRLHSMNRPLAYLTYAATALARDEYDDAMLSELVSQQGEPANFARVFAQMASEIREKQHRHQEMLAAANIQKSILPGPLRHEGAARAVDLHAEMHPAREIGGDFYDFFLLDERWLAVTVADVSGKGIPAALFMAHGAARRRRPQRYVLQDDPGQSSARRGERRVHVRNVVPRRARSHDRRAELLQCRPQSSVSAAHPRSSRGVAGDRHSVRH
jgi:phosphoserine phosphatase RsbU/P